MSEDEPLYSLAPASEKKRRRPALACEQCRSRKVRCDRNLPCTTCKKSRNQVCTYAPAPPPSKRAPKSLSSASSPGHPGSSVPGLGSRRDSALPLRPEPARTNTQHDHISIDAGGTLWQPGPANGTSASRLVSEAALTPESLPGSSTISSLVDRVKQLEQQLSNALQQRTSTEDCAAMCRDEPRAAEHLDRGSMSKTRYFGRSHWMNGARLIFPMVGFMGRFERDKTTDLYQDLQRCKDMARTIKAQRVPVFGTISIGKAVPPRELADELIETYLRTFETVYRAVHVPIFRADYERYWSNPAAASDAFVVLMQLCMALGAVFRDDAFALRASATKWVYEAQFWLMIPCEKSKMTMTGLQIHILLHHAKHVTGIGSDLTWVGAGSLLRMAMAMGLHEDPKCISRMTACRAEMRRRLWATILEIQLQSSLDSGGPPLIGPDDFDTEPPANLDDTQLLEDAETAYPVAKDPSEHTQMSVPLALFRTWSARLAVVRAVNEVRSSASYAEILRVNAALTTALQAMMRQLTAFRAAGSVSAFQLRYAEFAAYRFFLGLHQPVLSRALRNPVYYFSRKICVDISLRLTATAFVTGPAPRGTSEAEIARLFIGAAGQYRTTLVQCGMIAGLELVHHAEEEPKAHCGPLSSGSADLRAVLDSWKELGRKRIIAGETNIKGYLGGAGILAHIDGLERGCDAAEMERRVKGAARECLDECIEIMEALVAAGSPAQPVSGDQDPGVPELDLDDMEMFDEMLADWSWGNMTPEQTAESGWVANTPFPEQTGL